VLGFKPGCISPFSSFPSPLSFCAELRYTRDEVFPMPPRCMGVFSARCRAVPSPTCSVFASLNDGGVISTSTAARVFFFSNFLLRSLSPAGPWGALFYALQAFVLLVLFQIRSSLIRHVIPPHQPLFSRGPRLVSGIVPARTGLASAVSLDRFRGVFAVFPRRPSPVYLCNFLSLLRE